MLSVHEVESRVGQTGSKQERREHRGTTVQKQHIAHHQNKYKTAGGDGVNSCTEGAKAEGIYIASIALHTRSTAHSCKNANVGILCCGCGEKMSPSLEKMSPSLQSIEHLNYMTDIPGLYLHLKSIQNLYIKYPCHSRDHQQVAVHHQYAAGDQGAFSEVAHSHTPPFNPSLGSTGKEMI